MEAGVTTVPAGGDAILRANAFPRPQRSSGLQIRLLFGCYLLFALNPAFAGMADVWSVAIKAPASVPNLQVPPELMPALHFQQTFLKILAYQKDSQNTPDWVGELRGFIAADRPEDVVSHGVAEVARAWLARVNLLKIDAQLHQYYRRQVRFPEQFSEIEQSLPEPLRRDPWGASWVYKTSAPQGMGKLSGQRYTIGPALYPDLKPLKVSVGDRNPARPEGTLSIQSLGGKVALEIRSPTTAATLQPGGKFGDFTLLYLGKDWALFASRDQIFALTITN